MKYFNGKSSILTVFLLLLQHKYLSASHICNPNCCSGLINGTACLLTIRRVSCSCESVCEMSGNCCGDYYQTCKGISCSPVPTWLNIETNTTDIHLGDTIQYQCKSGYSFDAASNVEVMYTTCGIPSGNWTPDFTQCSEMPVEEDTSPIEGEYAQTIAGIMGGLIIVEIIVFIVIDIPSFRTNFIVCFNLKKNNSNKDDLRKDKGNKPRSHRKRTNSITPSEYDYDDVELDELPKTWNSNRFLVTDKQLMLGRRRVSASTISDVKLDTNKLVKPKLW